MADKESISFLDDCKSVWKVSRGRYVNPKQIHWNWDIPVVLNTNELIVCPQIQISFTLISRGSRLRLWTYFDFRMKQACYSFKLLDSSSQIVLIILFDSMYSHCLYILYSIVIGFVPSSHITLISSLCIPIPISFNLKKSDLYGTAVIIEKIRVFFINHTHSYTR